MYISLWRFDDKESVIDCKVLKSLKVNKMNVRFSYFQEANLWSFRIEN